MCLHCACALRSFSFACSSRSTRAVSAARCGWRLSPAESFLSLAPSAAIDWPICSISACLASAARFISSRLPLQHSRSERSSLQWHLSPAEGFLRLAPSASTGPSARSPPAFRSPVLRLLDRRLQLALGRVALRARLGELDLRHVHITQSIRASFRRGGLLDRVHRSCTCKGWNPEEDPT